MRQRFSALKPAAPAVLLCLTLNLVLFVGIALQRPSYLSDYRENANPDANHYVLLGRNYLLRGEYSRCDKPPYVPDMVRTPLYPLFSGALDLLGGAKAIYLAQALLQAGCCVLLYVLVRSCFGQRAAFWASLLLASDLMLVVYNFEAMAEPLVNFFLLASINCLLPSLLNLARAGRPCLGWATMSGLFLALATMTRPVAFYLPVVFSLGFMVVGLSKRRLGASFLGLLAFLAGAAPLPALWIARNAAVFSVAHLSTVDAVCSVYFAGGGAHQLRHGVSLEEAHAAIAREEGLPTHVEAMNPWTTHRTVAEMDAALRRAAFPVMTRYPNELVQSSLLGVVKASFSHNVAVLADLLGQKWIAPGTAGMLNLSPESRDRLAKNRPLFIAAFFWQMLHVSLSLILAVVGIVAAVRGQSTRPTALLLLAVLAYFYLTVAMFGFEAFYRCRVPVLPFLYVFAAFGIARLGSLGRKVPLAPQSANADSRLGGQG